MSRREILNIDTFNVKYNNNNQYQTYTLDSGDISTAPNSYNITIPLAFTRSNVKRIYLKSLEMPIAFPTIRATSNLHIFTISNTSNLAVTYPVVLENKNYTSITDLLNDLNTAFSDTYPTLGITLSIDSVSGNVKISSSNTTLFLGAIYISQTNLSYLLGFRGLTDLQDARSLTASSQYRLSLDDYINMFLPQFTSNAINSNGCNCSFKIPLNTVNGVVYYRNDTAPMFINVPYGYHFNSISVLITDKFGYSLNSFGADFSFSVEMEFY